MKKKILVTGAAGFIGYHLVKKLSERGDVVVGIDNINDYYDVNLKRARLADLGIDYSDNAENEIFSESINNFSFIKMDLMEREKMSKLFVEKNFDVVCNLAAQAGVRYSISNPHVYIESNINGFMNILEECRNHSIGNLVYASSSSVYGANEVIPFSTNQSVDHPISLYAATKKSNELMAHTYSHLYNIPTTGLRFFTVYGPWGRPDMAMFLFTEAIINGRELKIFNNGDMMRDFTYIDDIINGVMKTIDSPAKKNLTWSGLDPDLGTSQAPYKIYNIGNSSPVNLLDFVNEIEDFLQIRAIKKYLPMQPGDVKVTYADVSDLQNEFNYKPTVSVREGVQNFVKWYKNYYNL
jgi:UDP-glucuronate 4-epimerase